MKSAKASHERLITATLHEAPDLKGLAKKVTSFHESLTVWDTNPTNDREEFWHQLFVANPKLLAQAVPNCIIQIGDKCYVGGKGILNRGGRVTDFIYATKSTQNVVIVEIKTPATRLLGAKYREGVYSVSEELSGSIVQVLAQRNDLLKHFHTLKGSRDPREVHAFDPTCLVLAGNTEAELKTASRRASFDLFRANAGVLIVTYDELFSKIRALVEMLDECEHENLQDFRKPGIH